MKDRSLIEMVSAIIYQTQERYDRGEYDIQGDLASLNYHLKVARRLEEPLLEANILQLIGVLLTTAGVDLPAALFHFRQAQDIYQKHNRLSKLAQVTMRIGAWYGFSGDYTKSIHITQQAEAWALESGKHGIRCQCLCNIGSAYSHKADYTRALMYYGQAGQILKENTFSRRRGSLIMQVEYGMGLNHAYRKQYDEAWLYAERLYHLAKDYNDATFRVRSARLLAYILVRAPRDGQPSPMTYIREAYEVIEATGRWLEKPAVMEVEAQIHEQSGDEITARAIYQEAYQLYRDTNQSQAARNLRVLLAADVAPQALDSAPYPPEVVTPVTLRESALKAVYEVFIVEDSPDVQLLLEDLLGRFDWTFSIHKYASGEQAVKQLESLRPDVVLLDVRLQGQMDGYEVARRLRAHPNTQNTRIIMLSALDAPINEHYGMRAGADYYLPKPLQSRLLLEALTDLLPSPQRV